MNRDQNRFPNDSVGNALWQLYQQGANISTKTQLDFAVRFASEAVALKFAIDALLAGHKVSFSEYDAADFAWEICLHPYLDVTHAAISEYQTLLTEQAQTYGGKLSDWGISEYVRVG